MLPLTTQWAQRIDRLYLTFIRHCTGQFKADTDELLQHGRIPLLSSILHQQRIAALGHALRHEEVLGYVATSTYRIKKRKGGQHSTIDPHFQRALHQFSREDWRDVADDRDYFRDLARSNAAQHEDSFWKAYWTRRAPRWLDQGRIDRRVHLSIVENTQFPSYGAIHPPATSPSPSSVVHLTPMLKPFHRPPRLNIFGTR